MCSSHLAHLTGSIDAIRSLLLEKAGWTGSKAGAALQKLAILTDHTFPVTDTFSAISNTLFALTTNHDAIDPKDSGRPSEITLWA